MDRLLGGLSFSSIGNHFLRNDDDFADRLSHRYTTFIMLIFAIVVTSKTYIGDNIQCWCPAMFNGNYIDYANKICWVSNTYHVPLNEPTLPPEPSPEQMINYYQWVPLMLLFQALLFQLPNSIWKTLNGRAGLDISSVVEAATKLQTLEESQNREKMVEYMTRQLTDYLKAEPEARRGRYARSRQFLVRNVFWLCAPSYGTYLCGTFLLTKFLYALNAGLQLALLNAFIRRDYHVYGWEVLLQFFGYEQNIGSTRFPRVTFCDFKVRELKTPHDYTVQCVLPINLFNEKIFIFVWFWLVLVAVVACVSFVTWLVRCLRYQTRVDFVRTHLKRSARLDNAERQSEVKKYSREFVTRFLKPDGVLLLQLLEQNANQIVAVELIVALWKRFRTLDIIDHIPTTEEKIPLEI